MCPASRIDKDISIIGGQLLQPISKLIESLLEKPYEKSDAITSGYHEGSYSSASIILLVAMIESFIQRERYNSLTINPKNSQNLNPVKYLEQVLRYRRHRRIGELFDVRNAASHTHVWEVTYNVPTTGGRRFIKTDLVPGSHRLPSPPSQNTKVPRTKILKLHLKPDCLDRTDVQKSLLVSYHVLDFLFCKGRKPVNITRQGVTFQKKLVPFSDLGAKIVASINQRK